MTINWVLQKLDVLIILEYQKYQSLRMQRASLALLDHNYRFPCPSHAFKDAVKLCLQRLSVLLIPFWACVFWIGEEGFDKQSNNLYPRVFRLADILALGYVSCTACFDCFDGMLYPSFYVNAWIFWSKSSNQRSCYLLIIQYCTCLLTCSKPIYASDMDHTSRTFNNIIRSGSCDVLFWPGDESLLSNFVCPTCIELDSWCRRWEMHGL